MKSLLALSFLLMLFPTAQAKSVNQAKSIDNDGNALLMECRLALKIPEGAQLSDGEMRHVAHCLGMVEGIRDTLQIWERGGTNMHLRDAPACIPAKVTLLEAAQLVVKHLTTHPDQLSAREPILVIAAFRDAYPCSLNVKGDPPNSGPQNRQTQLPPRAAPPAPQQPVRTGPPHP